MRESCDGLIIRIADFGESDRLLTVLTAEKGKILISAKASRSMQSKTRSLCNLFTYANFELYEKNGRRWLSGGAVNETFRGLSSDMTGFALASYIVQLADEITGEGVNAEGVLRMTLNTLYAIENKLKPYEQLKSAYEIFAACEAGVSPDMSECGICRKPFEGDGWLDVMNGSLVCSECQGKRNGGAPLPDTDPFMARNILLPVNGVCAAAWRYVSAAPLKRVFAFSIEGESLAMLSRATEGFIKNHLERSFEALEFYNTVKD